MKKTDSYSLSGYVTLESMSQATWYNNWTISIFQAYLTGKILEVGCGIGNFTKILCSYGRVYAFDTDRLCIEETKQKVKGKAVVGFGDIEKGTYFFKNKKFDTITCINVLEHIKNDNLALKNMKNLLSPQGTLILLIPAHPFLFGEIDRAVGHYRRYTKKEITRKLKDLGMETILARNMNLLGAVGWFVAGKILKEDSVNQKRLKLFDRIAPFILPLEKILEPGIGTSILMIAKKSKS